MTNGMDDEPTLDERLNYLEQRVADLDGRAADGGRFSFASGAERTLRETYMLTEALYRLTIALHGALGKESGIVMPDSVCADLDKRFADLDGLMMQIIRHPHSPRPE